MRFSAFGGLYLEKGPTWIIDSKEDGFTIIGCEIASSFFAVMHPTNVPASKNAPIFFVSIADTIILPFQNPF